MSRGVKATLVLSAIFVSLAVTLFAWRQKTTGGSANNGYTREFQTPSKAARPWKPVISDAQMDRIIAAKQSGDYERVDEIIKSNMTPERRQRYEDQRRQKRRRANEVNERVTSIIGEEQFQQLLVAKKSWAKSEAEAKRNWTKSEK